MSGHDAAYRLNALKAAESFRRAPVLECFCWALNTPRESAGRAVLGNGGLLGVACESDTL